MKNAPGTALLAFGFSPLALTDGYTHFFLHQRVFYLDNVEMKLYSDKVVGSFRKPRFQVGLKPFR